MTRECPPAGNPSGPLPPRPGNAEFPGEGPNTPSGAPFVSVVIPTIGRRAALQCCLEALAQQTCPHFEVIVVDDGAPQPVCLDATAYERSFALRVIRQGNAGPAAARNRGVQAAAGEIVAFTDDDCLPDPTWLATLVASLQATPSALCGTMTYNGLPGDTWAATSQLIIDLVYAHFNARPNDAYFLTSNNIACRRDAYLELDGFDPSFAKAGAEDRDFCDRWRMSRRPLHLIAQPLLQHRHAQTLRKFLDIHYRYGRGAFLYQAKRRCRSSGTMKDDLGFHRSLAPLLRQHLRPHPIPRRLLLSWGIALWQIANATGFFRALAETRLAEHPPLPHA